MSDPIGAALEAATAAHPTPGFVAGAVRNGKTLYRGAFGPSDLKGGPPMRTDAVFRIASMTKAVTAVAAMQLVEAGQFGLDEPLGTLIHALAAPRVQEGFADDGTPRLRPAKEPITLRRLLAHTSGFVYEMWNADLQRFITQTDFPSMATGLSAALEAPLMFDPGTAWEYGIGIDWAGKVVEAVSGQRLDAYFAEHIFTPLGMTDTAFTPTPAMAPRVAGLNMRAADGSLAPLDSPFPPEPEFFSGGAGLLSTLDDYLAFLQMILHEGTWNGSRVLKPETLALMREDQLGGVPLRRLTSVNPFLSRDLTLQAQAPGEWGISWVMNREPGPNGRGAGAMAWAGLFNSYFWVDPAAMTAGVWMTQLLPFEDPDALAVFGAFERAVYGEG
ncbi:MAG TPA: serine hydrolase domain-containing protein [Caulobacteraceae bacterium]|jgi:CubicO group peptidase (beta-lactamase class C family)